MNSKLLKDKPPSNPKSLDLSVSKSKTFTDCKAKFRFQYIERLPRKEWEHHVFGTFCHEVLENFHQYLINGREESFSQLMTEAFKAAFANWKPKLNPEQLQESKDLFKYYVKKMNKEKEEGKLPKFTHVEKNFYININDTVLLSGFIDRIQIDPDGIVHVADYKTTKNKKYLKDYFQLLTYAWALCLEDPNLKLVRTSYILLRHNFELVIKEFTREEILKVEDKYLKYAEEISKEKMFLAKPSNLCKYCDFLDHCKDGMNFLERNGTITRFGETDW